MNRSLAPRLRARLRSPRRRRRSLAARGPGPSPPAHVAPTSPASRRAAHLRQHAHAAHGPEAAAGRLPAVRRAGRRVAAVRGRRCSSTTPAPTCDVRAWRFSYNARGIIEMPNRLRAKDTAVIMVHPWGIDDEQGWKTPEPTGVVRLLHAGEEPPRRPAHEGGDRPVPEAAARQGRVRDVQPARPGRPDPHEGVPLVRQDADGRGAGRGREGAAEGAGRRSRTRASRCPAKLTLGADTAGDRLLPAVPRPRRRAAVQRRRLLGAADPGQHGGDRRPERRGDLRRRGLRAAARLPARRTASGTSC